MGACINNNKAGPTTLGTMFPTLCQDGCVGAWVRGCVGSLLSFATNAWVPCCPFPTSAEKMLGTKLAVYLFIYVVIRED